MNSRIYWELSQAYNNLYENNHIIDYLIDGGFASSVDGARVIAENMGADWYNFIVEGRDPKTDKNLSQLSDELTKLRSEQRKIQQELLRNPGDKKLLSRMREIVSKIQGLTKARGELSSIQKIGKTSTSVTDEPRPRGQAPSEEGPADARVREIKSAMSALRRKINSEGNTPENSAEMSRLRGRLNTAQRTATQAEGGRGRPTGASRGSAPQTPKSGAAGAPDRGATNRQRQLTRRADAILANDPGAPRTPTYVNPQGVRVPLNAVSPDPDRFPTDRSGTIETRTQRSIVPGRRETEGYGLKE